MQRMLSKVLFYAGAVAAGLMMVLSTGCASGGFKLTRKYAQFVNSQNIIIRIILYILTSIVFAITMLIDLVLFNTMDFWQGRVSAGSYQFQKGDKTFYVEHEILPKTNLKRSTIKIMNAKRELLQEVVLAETPTQEVELSVDGVIRIRVQDIMSLPKISSFSKLGQLIEQKNLVLESTTVVASK